MYLYLNVFNLNWVFHGAGVVTYISVVLDDFGLTVVTFLIHHINLCMHLLAELLQIQVSTLYLSTRLS